jgi:hypothetical protein
VVPGTSHYRIAPDDPSFWNGVSDAASNSDSTTPPFVLEAVLPGGLHFTTAVGTASEESSDSSASDSVDSSQWVPHATFFADGTALEDRKVTLHLEGSRPLVVSLRALTGGVTVGPPESENGQP